MKVCIDFRDFKAGKPAIKNMRDGILESRHTLLVLTEAYLASGWTEFESLLSQTLDPANRKTRVVPMLKEKCKLPLEISYLTHVNFFDPDDWDVAWKQLLEALDSPVTPPPAPVDIRWFFGHRYGDLENFTGRAAEMQMLDDWLENNTDNLLVITAFGGFGKSALTWQWFNNRVDKAKWQTAIWWSFYEKESGFESFLAET
ncbi:TIR domain-containing protein, partial [Chloroflexi bacterium CFX6]|nr:TIR domain-containing protein [Chloroflexi bacterium CFX6]